MLELRTAISASIEQVPTVNSQLIVRSELLELPYPELCQRIKQEVDDNPALEVEMGVLSSEQLTPYSSYDELMASGGKEWSRWQDPALRAPAEYTLRDDLRRRVACSTDGQKRRIAEYLIENVDERGYLGTTVFDAALELDMPEDQVAAALGHLQSLVPPGVAARDLRECLLLQLSALPHEPPHVREIVTCCARAGEHGGWARLRRSLGLDEQQLKQALRFIRDNLRPYPGEQFHPSWHHLLPDNPYASYPDAVVLRHKGHFKIELAASRKITIRLSEAYRRLDESMRGLNLRAGDEATKHARAQVRAARQLIWSLDQRNRSLYKVTRAVVAEQVDFFREGVLALKPLTHKQIAEREGLHESTVSRAIAGKLLMLPAGTVVPYSLFFDDALPAKTVMKMLIRAESPQAPLTDEQLQKLLAERGFDLARRTITKYRHALGIPPSSQRKGETLA